MDGGMMIRAAVLPLLAILAACGGDAKAEVPRVADAVAVRTAPVTREWVTRPVEATGTLHSKDEIELSFKMPGIVARVLVAEGQQVRRGQPLATLDLREIDAQVAAAQSGVDQGASATWPAPRRCTPTAWPRWRRCRTRAPAPRWRAADSGRARSTGATRSIVAPADGVVLCAAGEGGELVAPGAPIVVLGSSERGQVLRVGRGRPRRRAPQAGRRGHGALRRLSRRGVRAGRVREVAPAADPAHGDVQVEVSVDGARQALASGLVGRVEVRPAAGTRDGAGPDPGASWRRTAPGDRLHPRGRTGRRARRLPVTVAFIQGERVAVSGGLERRGRGGHRRRGVPGRRRRP